MLDSVVINCIFITSYSNNLNGGQVAYVYVQFSCFSLFRNDIMVIYCIFITSYTNKLNGCQVAYMY